MFPFKRSLTTNNRTPGVNSKKYILLHHTATGEGTINGVLNTLTKGSVSCHFVVDTNGDAYKIGSPDDILWHAGQSQWGSDIMLNQYALGIEIIGPLANGGFTRAQLVTVTRLVEHLMAVFNIPKENVIKHADITWVGSPSMQLWDGHSPARKVDVAASFFPNNDFSAWRQFLVPNQVN